MPIANVRGVALNHEIIGTHGPAMALTPGGRNPLGQVRSLAERMAARAFRRAGAQPALEPRAPARHRSARVHRGHAGVANAFHGERGLAADRDERARPAQHRGPGLPCAGRRSHPWRRNRGCGGPPHPGLRAERDDVPHAQHRDGRSRRNGTRGRKRWRRCSPISWRGNSPFVARGEISSVQLAAISFLGWFALRSTQPTAPSAAASRSTAETVPIRPRPPSRPGAGAWERRPTPGSRAASPTRARNS